MRKIKGGTKAERMARYKAKQKAEQARKFRPMMTQMLRILVPPVVDSRMAPSLHARIDLSGAGKHMSSRPVTLSEFLEQGSEFIDEICDKWERENDDNQT